MVICLFYCSLSGCATIQGPSNIIMTTDEQFIQDAHGNRCKETEMLIYPDRIEYYTDCGLTRVVKTNPLPKPPCIDKQCKPSH